MKTDHLAVSEIFGPTIQGEGPSMGRPAFFLRLGGCNLTCSWCDTQYTWNSKLFDLSQEIKSMSLHDILDELYTLGLSRQHILVITGGEPMLQQERILALLKGLPHDMQIEIETNGTIRALPEWDYRTNVSFNVSPKLENSRNAQDRRFLVETLRHYALMTRARFKYVVAEEKDLDEVHAQTTLVRLHPRKLWIMPLGTQQEELETRLKWLAPLTSTRGWNLTTRMHVQIWNSERAH